MVVVVEMEDVEVLVQAVEGMEVVLEVTKGTEVIMAETETVDMRVRVRDSPNPVRLTLTKGVYFSVNIWEKQMQNSLFCEKQG